MSMRSLALACRNVLFLGNGGRFSQRSCDDVINIFLFPVDCRRVGLKDRLLDEGANLN